MKSSLKKLRGLAVHHRNDPKERRRRYHYHSDKMDELAQASQDMQDMKDCYDSLFSAAASTANSAYEFSEALKETGTCLLCLLEKTALNDDEESGKVLLMLGKAQFELQKLVDNYRSHIVQTISTPCESLLNELKTVEEMKRQCDEKRQVFDYVLDSQKEKYSFRNTKGATFSSEQLQTSQEEYDEEATLFVFRLKSLKQGQSRSLLTQAARHHAAQLSFFRKGYKCLQEIESHVKLVAEQQHIDYEFSELEDSGTDDDDYSYDDNDDGELSFDYAQNKQNQDAVSTSRNSMELDQEDHTPDQVATPGTAQGNLDKIQENLHSSTKGMRPISHSAPLFPDNKFHQKEKLQLQRSSTRKFHTYVLPTPLDCKISSLASSDGVSTRATQMQSTDGGLTHLSHTSPLGLQKSPTDSWTYQNFSSSQNSTKIESTKTPLPLAGGLSLPKNNPYIASDTKMLKRFAFSGPLTSKAWSSKPVFPLSYVQPSTSLKASPRASPPNMSSPNISELHELPRPPSKTLKSVRPPNLIGHSAPLVSNGREFSETSRIISVSLHMASPLPRPPDSLLRSFSIPSSGQRTNALAVAKLSEASNSDVTEFASPP